MREIGTSGSMSEERKRGDASTGPSHRASPRLLSGLSPGYQRAVSKGVARADARTADAVQWQLLGRKQGTRRGGPKAHP